MPATHPDFDLALLRTFATVAETGNFTRAARQLNRTQPVVSQHMYRLESDAGVTLFRWVGKRLELTEQGQVLLGYARRLIALADEARTTLTETEGPGRIAIGVNQYFASHELPGLLRGLNDEFAPARFDFEVGLSRPLLDRLSAGDLDLAIAKRHPELPSGPVLRTEALRWVAASPDVALPDPLPLVLFSDECVYRTDLQRRLDEIGRPWRVALSSPYLSVVQAAVLAGLGVAALLPPMMRDGMSCLEEKASKLPSLPEVEIAIHQSPARQTPLLREVVDYIVRHLTGASAA